MRSQELAISSSTPGVSLAGVVTHAAPARAAALLLAGSGPQDRDESIAGQRPLLVLSEALARGGITTVRFDDRGTGGSGGDYLALDPESLLDDYALQLLALRGACPDAPVAVVGHSQGALFALRLARREPSVAAAVLLAPSIRPGREVLTTLRGRMASDAGLVGADRAAYLEHSEALFECIASIDDERARRRAVERLVRDSVRDATDTDFAPDFASVEEYVVFAVEDALEWEVRDLLRARPAELVGGLPRPVLAVWGERDRHVDPLRERAAFDVVASRASASHVLPGLNHLFQRSESGRIDAYRTDGRPFLEPVPEIVASWLRDRAA